jgi:teichuronic acid biosynthesis glycosyltransferase TuaC
MKVLFLYRGKNASGDNRVVVTQGKSLEARGADIEYFALTGRGPGAYLRSLSAIRKQLRSGGADLIHAHYGFSGIAGLLTAGGRSLIVSFMGSDLLGSHTPDGKIKILSRLMIFLHRFLARYFYSLVIVKSAEMQGKLSKNTRLAVIPNGVDFGVFKPVERALARRQLNLDQDECIVLFPADPDNPEKNFALASAAVERLRAKGFRLLDINNAGREEMNLLYNAADLLLITSFHEGSPNIVKEAMASCCPVVSTAVGDIAWLFGDQAGHYLSGFDAEETADKIEEAARFRKEFAFTEGRSRIAELGLDAERIAGIIMGHYSRLTGETK